MGMPVDPPLFGGRASTRKRAHERFDEPAVVPRLDQGDIMILTGLVSGELSSVFNDENRLEYKATLERLRQKLYDADRLP